MHQMGEKADITPKVLKWARESARMSIEVAASKVPISAEKLIAWESGEELPTINQAQKLAKAYRRPFALLFLAEVPSDFQPLRDFRRKGSKPLGTGSVFIIREIQQKQAWISELNRAEHNPKAPFVGRFNTKDDPESVANDILESFNIQPSEYASSSPIREWIDKAESNGIFVSRTSFIHSRLLLDSDEIQGFAIADPFAPFVFVNSDDWDKPQLFTLVHELAHIWIAESGISNDIELTKAEDFDSHPIELFCNEVAGNALMPTSFMDSLPSSAFDSTGDIYKFANRLGVSSLAFLVRGRNLRFVSIERYKQLKNAVDIEYKAFLKREEEKKSRLKIKEKKGGPNPYLLQVNRNSRLFTQTVLDAFRGGIIEPTQASKLLNVRITRFAKLEEQLYR